MNGLRAALAAAAICWSSAALAGNVTVSRSIEGPSSQATVHEVTVPASRSAVWQAISTAEGWQGWAVPTAWLDPSDPTLLVTSYDPGATAIGDRTISQRILLSVPERLFAFRTVKAAAGFHNFEALAPVTWLFELEPDGPGRTRVRLTGSGYPRTAAGDEIRAFFEAGNSIALESLRQRFAEGPVDWRAKLGAARASKSRK